MADFIQAAFEAVLTEAVQAEDWYVILTEVVPYYGGPEEGGWWGSDSIVVAYQSFASYELAIAAKERVESLAQELTEESRMAYGRYCELTMEWLEQRGLDADFLPEPDGESRFYVSVSQEVPANSFGCRQYS